MCSSLHVSASTETRFLKKEWLGRYALDTTGPKRKPGDHARYRRVQDSEAPIPSGAPGHGIVLRHVVDFGHREISSSHGRGVAEGFDAVEEGLDAWVVSTEEEMKRTQDVQMKLELRDLRTEVGNGNRQLVCVSRWVLTC